MPCLARKTADLPAYSVRVSRRAKHVNLCVRPHTGLEVIVPQRFNKSQIPRIVEKNRDWIERALEKWAALRQPVITISPPASLPLRALGQTVRLRYKTLSGSESVYLSSTDNGMVLSGNTADDALLRKVLEAELKRIAKAAFTPWLSRLAATAGLRFSRLTVRGQKGRWGSCSSAANISLNYKLLFLPPDLVRYVLLHELAHTRHLNHSAAYWRFLTALEPAALELDAQLRDAARYIPDWLAADMR